MHFSVLWLSSCSSPPRTYHPTANSSELTPVTLRVHAWTGYAEDLITDFSQHMQSKGYAVTIEIQAASGLESFTDALKNNTADLISPAHDLTRTFIQQN